MNAREFLDVAEDLAANPREGEWRSAISRAYYAAFHVARDLFRRCGFEVPDAERTHRYLSYRLSNSGHPDVIAAGNDLDELRRARNRADYDLHLDVDQKDALEAVARADQVIRLLEDVVANDSVRGRITQAMRDYERNVLGEVTYRGPSP